MGVMQSGQMPFDPGHECCVPHLLPQAQGSGVPASGLMKVPQQPRLSPQHWNPSAPTYLPGQTLSLIAAMLTWWSVPFTLPASGSSASVLYLSRPTLPAGVTPAVLGPRPTGLCPCWWGESGPANGLSATPSGTPCLGQGRASGFLLAGQQELGPRGARSSLAVTVGLAGIA